MNERGARAGAARRVTEPGAAVEGGKAHALAARVWEDGLWTNFGWLAMHRNKTAMDGVQDLRVEDHPSPIPRRIWERLSLPARVR